VDRESDPKKLLSQKIYQQEEMGLNLKNLQDRLGTSNETPMVNYNEGIVITESKEINSIDQSPPHIEISQPSPVDSQSSFVKSLYPTQKPEEQRQKTNKGETTEEKKTKEKIMSILGNESMDTESDTLSIESLRRISSERDSYI